MVSYTSILCAIIILTTFLKFEIHSKKEKFKKIAPLKKLYNLCYSLQGFRNISEKYFQISPPSD